MSKQEKAPTKAQAIALIAEKSGVAKKDVVSVMDALEKVIDESLKKHKEFNLMGLMKIVVARKKATKERKGTNPFTGNPMVIKAKLAHDVVRVRVLKGLKDKI